MTLKEFAIKVGYDGAAMKQFQQDCETAAGIAKRMGVSISQDAQIVDRSVTTGMNRAGQAIRNVTTIFNQGGKDIRITFQDMGNAIALNTTKMTEATGKAETLGAELEKVAGRAILVAPAWLALRFAMTSVIQLFQQSISFMVEWETQMAKIRVVTGATKDEVDVLSGQLLKVSEDFGVSTKEVGDAANQWLRMGASMSDVVPLLETAARQSKVSGQSMEETANSLNSIRSAYGMSLSEVVKSSEKLLDIEAKSGVSLDVLTSAFEKAGVKAQQTGVSFDQLAGYIVAVNQKTRQSGELIGTQLTSLFTRLGTTAIDTAQQISSVGFFLNSTGKVTTEHTSKLRDMNSILKDLSASWKTLSNEQQDVLAKALGGNLRTSAVIALLSNMDAAIKASGASAEDSKKALGDMMDTTQTKITQLQSAWAIFLNTIGNTNAFKGFLDGVKENVMELTQLIKLINHPIRELFTKHELYNPKAPLPDPSKEWEGSVGHEEEDLAKIEAKKKYNEQIKSEQTIKNEIKAIQENAILTREDALATALKERDVLNQAQGVAKAQLKTEIDANRLKIENLQVAKEIEQLTQRQTTLEAQLKAEGASQLQIEIAHLAYLQQINDTKGAEAQQNKVNAKAIEEFRSIQDSVIDALVSQQKLYGDTAIQQIQNKIALEDQVGIHLQGIDLLKQQLDLYKAINEQQNKTPLERAKELKDLIRRTHSPDEFKETENSKRLDEMLTKQARKKGISDDTIQSILHPENSNVDQGGVNSLQTELRNGLSDPLGRNINDLAGTIRALADAINRPAVGPKLSNSAQFVNPATGAPVSGAQAAAAQTNIPSYAIPFRGKDVTVDLGGINVTVNARTKNELKSELSSILQEMIANHMVRPDSKMNQAIKKVVDAF